jgi:hypothetical protein
MLRVSIPYIILRRMPLTIPRFGAVLEEFEVRDALMAVLAGNANNYGVSDGNVNTNTT